MRTSIFISLSVLLAAMPTGLQAQEEDAEAGRYNAAIEWVNLVVVEGNFEEAAAQAHEAVATQMTAAALEGAWAQLEPQLGALISLEPKEQGLEQGLNLVVLTGVFDAGTFDVQVTWETTTRWPVSSCAHPASAPSRLRPVVPYKRRAPPF